MKTIKKKKCFQQLLQKPSWIALVVKRITSLIHGAISRGAHKLKLDLVFENITKKKLISKHINLILRRKKKIKASFSNHLALFFLV